MLSIVIPITNLHEVTDECITNLRAHAVGKVEVIVVDNASTPPYTSTTLYTSEHAKIIRNEVNVGFWPSMLQGIKQASSQHVLCMHNDVFIWEHGYDQRILNAFADEKTAAVGLFGGRGLSIDGGRGLPESNMLGQKYGTHGSLHGNLLTNTHPAVIFDSLAIAVDSVKLNTIDCTLPPHHWTDRLLCLRLLRAEYHLQTVGVGFDHGGSFTSNTQGSLHTFAEEWCARNGIPLHPDIEQGTNWDYTLYMYGKRIFEDEFRAFTVENGYLYANSVWVSKDYTLSFY